MDTSTTINKETVNHFLKNPLGLIGLITVTFEAIAVAAFSYGIDKMQSSDERLPIIWFIVLFPVLVLITLFILVVFYHTHLYAPSDYKDESNFVNISNEKIDKRREAEAKEIVREENKEETPQLVTDTKSLIEKAETLGLRIASEHFRVTLQKDVRLHNPNVKQIIFDGMAFKGRTLCVAEVKLLPKTGWRSVIERSLANMHMNIVTLERNGYQVDAFLIVVANGNLCASLRDQIEKEFYSHPYNIAWEITSLELR